MMCNYSKKKYLNLALFIVLFIFVFPQINSAKISDRRAVKTYWSEAPIMPGAAKYFVRTEKIEKKAKSLNNHPIKLNENTLRVMLKQLSYKYDRDEPEIPLFSKKELILLSENVSKALMEAQPNEDVTFVIKGPHKSTRWGFAEDRLTAGRIFVSNNQLNLIFGSVQVNLQPTLDERYQGNVWETAKLTYDIGYRKKKIKYEGLIVVYNQKKKGIYRKSTDRKDWFVFTNDAYKQARQGENQKNLGKEQYKTLQQQIDTLQKQLNKQDQPQQRKQQYTPPPQQRQQIQRKKEQPVVTKKRTNASDANVLEQRIKTIEQLYKKGILSEEEYKKKRNEILKGL